MSKLRARTEAESGWERRRLFVTGPLGACVLALMAAGCGGSASTSTQASSSTVPTPAPASTTTTASKPPVIMVQRGVGGGTLGMSEAEIRQQLGNPLRADQVANATGPYTEFTYPDRFTVAFQRGGGFSGGASSFYVKGATIRTPEELGVGSTEAAVQARIPGVTCDRAFGELTCHVGGGATGGTVTLFGIAQGKVTYVRVARTR